MHMFQNGQTNFKNLAATAAGFLKCVWPFWDIMHWRVKGLNLNKATTYRHYGKVQNTSKGTTAKCESHFVVTL